MLVPAGFVTDFASIPRLFWRVLPPTGSYGKAAVIHDYLYRTGAFTRSICDGIFLEAMCELGVPGWKRRVMFRAVRLFGGSSYQAMARARALRIQGSKFKVQGSKFR